MTSDSPAVDPRHFRDVAGSFATGVTVVTTHDDEHGPRGLTANAVASLSLDPSLFLVCVDLHAGSYEAMERAGRFAINMLAADQQDISQFFARANDPDAPMGPHAWRMSEQGSPLLEGRDRVGGLPDALDPRRRRPQDLRRRGDGLRGGAARRRPAALLPGPLPRDWRRGGIAAGLQHAPTLAPITTREQAARTIGMPSYSPIGRRCRRSPVTR